MMVIFLDFDGVLHPEPCHRDGLLSELPRLESILRDFAAVQIVVTSTWRNTRTIAELQQLFSPDIATRVVGVTPRWQELPGEISYQRQAEVEAWLREHRAPWDKFVVLDDRAWLFSPFYRHLLRCNPKSGMDQLVERTLRELLRASM